MMWTAAAADPAPLSAQDDPGFRQFRKELVPSPDALLSKLSQLQGVKLPQTTAQKLKQLGEQILGGMTPEQQRQLQGLAQQFMQGESQGVPPAYQDLAQNLQRQLQQQGSPVDLAELLNQLPTTLPGTLDPLKPPHRPSQSSPSAPDTGPVTPNQSANPANRSRTPQGPLDSADPQDSTPSAEFGAGEISLPQGDEARRIVEQFRNSIPETESRPFQPDPEWFEQKERPTGYSAEDSNESIGNRFDRMLMDAVNKQLNAPSQPDSRIVQSVGTLFEGLIDRVHKSVRQRDWSSTNRRAEQLGNRLQNRGRRLSAGSRFRGLAWPGLDASPRYDLWGIALLGGLFGGLGLWWLSRNRRQNQLGRSGLVSGRRFRVPRIRDSHELVQAVDDFLLTRFGKSSDCWHSRRAEMALCSLMPGRDVPIRQLIDCYEYARYSEVGNSLDTAQVQRCREILRGLAAAQRLKDAAVPGGESKETDAPKI